MQLASSVTTWREPNATMTCWPPLAPPVASLAPAKPPNCGTATSSTVPSSAKPSQPGLTVADIGSGAGLPGIPLAIARPDLTIYLVEPLLKRSTFLTEVVRELGLENVTVIRGRAEEREVKAALGLVDVVTSRAVAPLGKLAGWSLPLVKPGGHMLAMKGASVYDELARDRVEIRKAGGGTATIFTVGNDLPEPTTVIDIPKKR